MAQTSALTPPAATDPRFALSPAELVAAIVAGKLGIDLGTYPDADTAIYARISKDRSDRTSVERQLEICIEYAQERGLSYVIFSDRKSAYRPGVTRKDYNALLHAIRARRIKRTLSYKIDRLYRQVEELMDVIKTADRGRVPITLIGIDDDDTFDLTTAKGCDEAIGRVLEAQRESRRTSERTKMQRRKAREKGVPSPGTPAFGWRDKFHHDEIKAEALRDAYKSVLHGTSTSAIARTWNAAGFRGTRGAQWDTFTVKRVLMNQRNVGRLTHTYEAYDEHGNKREITEIVRENAFDEIIDVETFDAVQRELARRSKPQRHPRRRSTFTGLIRCGRAGCGRNMTRAVVEGVPVYRCWAYVKGVKVGCGLTINAEYVDPFVTDALFKYMDAPELQEKLRERAETGTPKADLIAQRDRLTKKRDQLRTRMLADDYDEELHGYDEDVRKLGEQLRDVNAHLTMYSPVHPAAAWAGNGTGLREAWEDLDDDEKRAVIGDALHHVTIKPSRMPDGSRVFGVARVALGDGTETH